MSNVNMLPAFEKDNIAIAFAVDQNYVRYLKYAIKSIVANCKRGNLDIIVLHAGPIDGSAITDYFKGKPNLSIRFMDISDIVQREIAPYFVGRGYLTTLRGPDPIGGVESGGVARLRQVCGGFHKTCYIKHEMSRRCSQHVGNYPVRDG